MRRGLTQREIAGVGMTSQRTRDRLVARLRDKGIENETVLAVIGRTPRHLFMDEALASRAYEDTSLPIGHGQTISQPFVVARMTEALYSGLTSTRARVLELGTGSGYQAAVLAALVAEVVTVERIRPLLVQAQERFRALGLANIRALHGDGGDGCPSGAPYDGIVLTAAPEVVPAGLFDQLTVGGCLIAPVGQAGQQELIRYRRRGDGVIERETLAEVSFVPFRGGRE